jgi:hypothetical protein
MMNISKHIFPILLLGFTLTVQAGPTVGFSSDKIKARTGDTVTVDIVITDFPTTGGGGLTLSFNPKILQVMSVALNTGTWGFAGQDGIVDNSRGNVSDILFSSYNGVMGDATVATVTLSALKPGRSALTLSESGLNPFASSGQRLQVQMTAADVLVHK